MGGLLRLVEFTFDEVEETGQTIPGPGTRFVMAGVEYECVMVSPDRELVHAVPRQ